MIPGDPLMNSTETLSNRLKKYRKENGYSQAEIAAYLGISRQAISQWENDKVYPDIDNLILLCELYKITMDELLPTSVSVSQNERNPNITEKDEQKDLRNIIENLIVIIAMIFCSQVAFLGIFVPIILLLICKRQKKIHWSVYLIAMISIIIGIHNTYSVIFHYFFMDYGISQIEPM